MKQKRKNAHKRHKQRQRKLAARGTKKERRQAKMARDKARIDQRRGNKLRSQMRKQAIIAIGQVAELLVQQQVPELRHAA